MSRELYQQRAGAASRARSDRPLHGRSFLVFTGVAGGVTGVTPLICAPRTTVVDMTTYVGIDPGRHGAFAILDESGDLESVVDLPTVGAEPVAADVAALLTAIDDSSRLFVALEEPFVMTPRASLLTQGIGYGILLGVVGALGCRHVRIPPKQWKASCGIEMGGHLSQAEKKQLSLDRATELWPHSAHNWSRKKDDGRAEAAMIGLCGLRHDL